MKIFKHKHIFESDGGRCIKCGKTVVDLMDEKKIEALDDDNIPVVSNVKSNKNNHFWGNETTGYVSDELAG